MHDETMNGGQVKCESPESSLDVYVNQNLQSSDLLTGLGTLPHWSGLQKPKPPQISKENGIASTSLKAFILKYNVL